MKNFSIYIIMLSILLSTEIFSMDHYQSALSGNWQFRCAGDSTWRKASVPGCIHTDLLNCNLIPDPFYACNEQKLQWIESEDWDYSCSFDCDSSVAAMQHIELIFEWLDTFAEVSLNGKKILSADNMFRTWRVDVKKIIRPGKNQLDIRFSSAVNFGKKEAEKLSYTLPGDEKVFTRKTQSQYGWDWGPRFVTCGVGRDIKIAAWNGWKIDDIRFVTESISPSNAKMSAIATVRSDSAAEISYSIQSGGTVLASGSFKAKQGTGSHKISFEVANPQLWYCNGLGEPHLYTAASEFAAGCSKQTIESTFGIRTIELVQKKDLHGRTFYFKLNGKPFFAKGANYIPADNFIARATMDKFDDMLHSAAAANMNMIRVWGGGNYERDEFYSLCDKLGLLVWQDFMFACSMYPGDRHFLENVRTEAADNITRLANHPSIALWCGNNEIDEGWHNWGWQLKYIFRRADSAKIWNDYKKIFHELLPAEVAAHDGTRPYIPSSPLFGWGRKESMKSGDSHYWGVWWGNQPFDVYNEKVPRFMSEYGFQGMPPISTFRTFCSEDDFDLRSEAVKNHQKHPTGYETIRKYMERDYNVPESFERYVYISQLLQAEGMTTAITAQRRAMPYCMGSLYWQLNDCWPVTSWSSLDYFNNWKALHYYAKRAFAPVIISAAKNNNKHDIYIISDSSHEISGSLNLRLLTFDGKVVFNDSITVNVKPGRSNIYYTLPGKIIKKHNPAKVFMLAELRAGNKQLADAFIYFANPREQKLPDPKLEIRQLPDGMIEVSAKALARGVYLSGVDGESLRLNDNYFDLAPGAKRVVKLEKPREAQIKAESLYFGKGR